MAAAINVAAGWGNERRSPSANAGAFAGGDFLYVCIKQAQKLSAR